MAARDIKPRPVPGLTPALKASGEKIRHSELEIEISELVLDTVFQPRRGLKDSLVLQIKRALEAGEYIAPVDVFLLDGDEERGHLVDGWHRLAAHERAGRTTILANVYEGTRADAFLHSGAANLGDKLGLTQDERKAFALKLLRIPEHFKKSARRLATFTGLSHETIRKYKRTVKAQDKDGVLDGLDVLRPQYIRGGKVVEMDATGIAEAAEERAAEAEAEAARIESTPVDLVEVRETEDGRKLVEVLQVLPPTRDGAPGVVVSRAEAQEVSPDTDVQRILAARSVDVKAVIDDLELGVVLPPDPAVILHGVRVRRWDLSRKAWNDLADSRRANPDGCAPLEICKAPAPDLMYYALACMKRDGWAYVGLLRLANVVFFAFSSGHGDHAPVQDGENIKDYLARARARFENGGDTL